MPMTPPPPSPRRQIRGECPKCFNPDVPPMWHPSPREHSCALLISSSAGPCGFASSCEHFVFKCNCGYWWTRGMPRTTTEVPIERRKS